MVKFLDNEQEFGLRQFVSHTLAYKYNMPIEVREELIVAGTTGSETIEEALKIVFFPANATVQWVEDRISADIHKYCYENNLRLNPSIVIEKDVWNSEIRYKLVYTDGRW